MPHVTKYNARWLDDMSSLEIELKCIEWGGKWKDKTGKECGDGLFNHFMNARKLLWPNRYRHRWTDLMYKNFIENDVTVLAGGASTQKTSHSVEYCLMRYWAQPFNTLVIFSTVNMEKLEVGVWGECKMLWGEARQRYDWLAGNMIDHKKAISTDNLEDDGVRDMRRGCISRPCYVGGKWQGLGILAGLKQENIIYFADECFPAGTMVDTPNGKKPIETLNPGDEVLNAFGVDEIVGIRRSFSRELCRIRLGDGRSIVCTHNHSFFTQHGWVKAIDINCSHYIIATNEAMQIMRGDFRWTSELSSVSPMPRKGHDSELRILQETIPKGTPTINEAFLQSVLLGKMEVPPAGIQGKVLQQREGRKNFQGQADMVSGTSRVCGCSLRENEEEQSDEGEVYSLFGTALSFRKWGERGERERSNGSGKGSIEAFRKRESEIQLCNPNQNETRIGLSTMLQSGCSTSRIEAHYRGGRSKPLKSCSPFQRLEERQLSNGSWVESCEIFQPPDFEASSSGGDGVEVFNLHVKNHHSYSVNGLVSLNCQFMQESFSLSWPHLFSNGNVKIIASGNYKHDPDDELGKTAEPKEGWLAHPEPEKTEVWETKFMGGKCVNLVGTDSPNFDVPEGSPEPYPRLIGRKFANRIAHDHGLGSFEYYRLVKGVMKVAFSHSRVITRQLCREHHALEQVKWKDTKQTHIYALDPSYGGEDRCVGMPGKFGEGVDGKQILELMPYRVFRLDLRREMAVEDQIAEILAEELDTYDVAPENCFYDSTGKGTIGAAFARKFGHRVPVAVDSGAQPTKRPVREDLFVEEKGAKRLKRCDEHYSKFVTEMWFSLRYTIEAEQLRGLLDDVMNEGCARIYEVVKGNRYEIEAKSDPKKKEDLKRRLGKSPDLFDCAVILTEGARQRGFKIRRLGSIKDTDNDAFQWLNDRVRNQEKLIQSKQLDYAAA